MAKFRWTREALRKRDAERLAPYPQVEPPFETTQAYLARKRAQRVAEGRRAAESLASLPRPTKPPRVRIPQ